MAKSFSDKVVIVTGSSQGIGKATALEFLRAGDKVVINGRNPERLEKVSKEFEGMGYQPFAVQGDLCQQHDCELLISKTVEHFGQIDILVNNAGGGFRGRLDETYPEVFRDVVNANLMSAVYCTLAAIPEITRTKGSITFISSLSGIRATPLNGPYCVAKMGLTALAQSLRMELSDAGIHIGIILVGWTDFADSKRVLSADGTMVPIHRKYRQTRELVARIILSTIRKRKFKVVLTFPGKIMVLLDRFCPSLLDWILKKSAVTEMYNR